MATPHVSGAAALVRALHPAWVNQQVVDFLFATARDKGAPGRDDYFGYGIVDAGAAVGYVPPSVTISGPSTVRPNYNCTWWAIVTGGVPPYAYSWIPGGAQTSEVTMSFSSSETLRVSVWDSPGNMGSASKNITVSPSAPICRQ